MNRLQPLFYQLSKYKNITLRYKYLFILLLVAFLLLISFLAAQDAEKRYQTLLSVTIYDRDNTPLSLKENTKGHYVSAIETLPEEFSNLLLKKEDRYFYYHFGINPLSSLRSIYNYVVKGKAGGGSTITEQLAKNLLATEQARNVKNKLREIFYSLAIELFYSKAEVLTMYANTVYLGNQVQGFQTASYAYFAKPLGETSHSEQISLLATLSYPNARNPWQIVNTQFAESLNQRISPTELFVPPEKTQTYSFQNEAFFELRTAGINCPKNCHTTISASLTKSLREILQRQIATKWQDGARNGAIVVINPQTAEILALVGSKDPSSTENGDQINMALAPRPIGSTVKPFIYLKGFVEGLRPYTLVDDREYKYSIATGFPLYPKNFDGQYRGEVTLHQALSNSLNVPSVKVMEYIGLPNFYAFLSNSLKFKPIQSLDSYQYGIALGGLEMDLLTLTHYFTIFPSGGSLKPIRVLKNSTNNFSLPPQSDIKNEIVVADKKYTELVHAILSDRLSGVNQFGLESTLNIETTDYGVKTGTSRDFHDSWVVGYTADFVVGVWVGNTENKPLKQVTGQSGAGAIWHDTMNLLLETPYRKNPPLERDSLRLFPIKNSQEWGLIDDIIEDHQTLLLDNRLITSPYQNDSYEFFSGMVIPLKSQKDVTWSVNGKELGTGKEISFSPQTTGNYEIIASDEATNEREIINVSVVNPQLQ